MYCKILDAYLFERVEVLIDREKLRQENEQTSKDCFSGRRPRTLQGITQSFFNPLRATSRFLKDLIVLSFRMNGEQQTSS